MCDEYQRLHERVLLRRTESCDSHDSAPAAPIRGTFPAVCAEHFALDRANFLLAKIAGAIVAILQKTQCQEDTQRDYQNILTR